MTDDKWENIPVYDFSKSFQENFENGPFLKPNIPKREPPVLNRGQSMFKLLDIPLNSRLGVPAGLLLNSNWVDAYAGWGFDILTYKTVRSIAKKSYPLPNCIYINISHQLNMQDPDRTAIQIEYPRDPNRITITNSFGMPSLEPKGWQADVQKAKAYLSTGQILIVSVVGTIEKASNFKEFIKDFVLCSELAEEAGADIIELNYSCPNSPTAEGEIFTDPKGSAAISKAVKKVVRRPIFIKIGGFASTDIMKEVITSNAPFIDGIVGINTIKMKVFKRDGVSPALGPERVKSGVCGWAIKHCSLNQTRAIARLRDTNRYDFCIIGIGGVFNKSDIEDYLDAGANAVQSCTGAMFHPDLAYRFYIGEQQKV